MSKVEITKELIDEMCNEIVYLRTESQGLASQAKEEIDDLKDTINDLELDIKNYESVIIEKDDTIAHLKKENEVKEVEIKNLKSNCLKFQTIQGKNRIVQYFLVDGQQKYRVIV